MAKKAVAGLKKGGLDGVVSKLPEELRPIVKTLLHDIITKGKSFSSTLKDLFARAQTRGSPENVAMRKIVTKLRIALLLKLKINLCLVECVCKKFLMVYLDPKYEARSWPYNRKGPKKKGCTLESNADVRACWLSESYRCYTSRLAKFLKRKYPNSMANKSKRGGMNRIEPYTEHFQIERRIADKNHKGKMVCKMSLEYKIAMCKTCCCRDGLVVAYINSGLDFATGDKATGDKGGDSHSCKAWFTFNDAVFRAAINIFKA